MVVDEVVVGEGREAGDGKKKLEKNKSACLNNKVGMLLSNCLLIISKQMPYLAYTFR